MQKIKVSLGGVLDSKASSESGVFYESDDVIVFFGNANISFQKLQTRFPSYKFIRLTQVHKNSVHLTLPEHNDLQFVADAHMTTQARLALCISTADCLPIMIYSPISRWVAGIHAGWRGVASQIFRDTVIKLDAVGVPRESLQIFIGPHIQMASFEVHEDVKEAVLESTSRRSALLFRDLGAGKSLVNLKEVVYSQAMDLGIGLDQIHSEKIDTQANDEYNSVRREKGSLKRNISFICLK